MTTHNWQAECIFPQADDRHVAVPLYCSTHKHRRTATFEKMDQDASLQELWACILLTNQLGDWQQILQEARDDAD